MKSPRDGSMILAAVGTALTVAVVASVTSGVAFTSLTRGTSEAVVVEASADAPLLPSQVGDVVEAAQADALERSQSAYKLDTGPQVLVEAEQALPDVVVDEVRSELTKVTDAKGTREDAQALADQVSDSTGKSVVLVYQAPDGSGLRIWTHTKVRGVEPFADFDQSVVVAELEDWIAQQTSPTTFEVIVRD